MSSLSVVVLLFVDMVLLEYSHSPLLARKEPEARCRELSMVSLEVNSKSNGLPACLFFSLTMQGNLN
jgi:hypothetical protein